MAGVVAPRVGAGPVKATISRRRMKLFFQRIPSAGANKGIANLAFTVTRSDGTVLSGTTPSDGLVEVLLAAGETAQLDIIGSRYDVSLLAGGLFSITELRGVQQRLNILGYNAGTVDASAPPVVARTGFNQTEDTEHAIVNFQSDHKPLIIDGIAGAKTQARLREVVQNSGG